MGVPYLGGGGAYAGYVLWWLRHCRDPFYRFMVLGGGGGGVEDCGTHTHQEN